MTYCFDLDGTLCTNTDGDYKNAKPFNDRIKKVNQLYDGHTIVISTARGFTTGIDWLTFTNNQLKSWGIKYDQLYVGRKPYGDVYIDDKGINDLDFFNKSIGSKLDDYVRMFVKKTLDGNLFPDYDDIYTDTLSELIDKLCIVHIRYWYLEDAMAMVESDEELLRLRKKSESLFKEKRPMLVAGFDKLIMKLLNGELDYTSVNTKHYKGWNQKED